MKLDNNNWFHVLYNVSKWSQIPWWVGVEDDVSGQPANQGHLTGVSFIVFTALILLQLAVSIATVRKQHQSGI